MAEDVFDTDAGVRPDVGGMLVRGWRGGGRGGGRGEGRGEGRGGGGYYSKGFGGRMLSSGVEKLEGVLVIGVKIGLGRGLDRVGVG